MHQFRDKAGAARERASAGLLFYPVLMAADVLAYRAHEVPVGEDQREHIELMRDVAEPSTSASARRWWCPRATSRRSARACATSRSPTKKMSTTGGTPRGHRLRRRGARRRSSRSSRARRPTPAARSSCADDKPGITNLIEILAVVRGVTPADIEREFADAGGYGDFKRTVGEEVADLAGARPRAVPRAARGHRGDRGVPGRGRREGARARRSGGRRRARAAWASAVLARVRRPGGLGSPRCASPSSSWTSTSSRGPSTCCSR